jgi:hypothetical protein
MPHPERIWKIFEDMGEKAMDSATPAIPYFMQYGAMGILALAFIVVLVLFIRSDKRSQKYADCLAEVNFDRSQLIEVLTENTRAITTLAANITQMSTSQERVIEIILRLEKQLA